MAKKASQDYSVDSILQEILAEENDGKFSFAGKEFSCTVVEAPTETTSEENGFDVEGRFPGAREFMNRDVHEEAAILGNDGDEEEFFDEEDEFFYEDDDEFSDDDEFFDEEDDSEEVQIVKSAAPKSRVALNERSLFSYRGKHVAKESEVTGEKAEPKVKKNALLDGVKGFFKENVIPLFMEEDESVVSDSAEELLEVEGEAVENSETIEEIDENMAEEKKSVKEMVSSAGVAVTGFGKKCWSFMKDKAIDPIVDKLRLDSDDYEEDDAYVDFEDESTPQKPASKLHIVKRKSQEEDEGEFFDVEEKPKSLKQKIEEFFARDAERDEFEDEEIFEEEKPSFMEALLALVTRDDDYDDYDDYEDYEEEEPEEEVTTPKAKKPKKKFKLLEKAKQLIYESEPNEDDEDADAVVIDVEAFDAVMREKEAERAKLNAEDPEIVFISQDDFPDEDDDDFDPDKTCLS